MITLQSFTFAGLVALAHSADKDRNLFALLHLRALLQNLQKRLADFSVHQQTQISTMVETVHWNLIDRHRLTWTDAELVAISHHFPEEIDNFDLNEKLALAKSNEADRQRRELVKAATEARIGGDKGAARRARRALDSMGERGLARQTIIVGT